MDHIRKTGVAPAPKQAPKKAEKQEAKKEAPAAPAKAAPAEAVSAAPAQEVLAFTTFKEEPKNLEDKVLDFINKHPKGVKISEMEAPLGETRMKLGFTAKGLLDEGKVQKIDNVYFPLK